MLDFICPWVRTLLACGVLLAGTASANMELSNVIVHFEPGDSARQDVEVSNTGSDPLYVEVTPARVLSPGDQAEDRSPITDPRQAGLLVTPNKLIVPPGGTKVVRLVKLGQSREERVYRIAARPVVGGVQAGQTGLKVMIGYEILAIVYPDNPQPGLKVTRQGRTLHVENSGNANVLLREGFQCASPDLAMDACAPLPGRRVYPGNQWTLELPHDLPVTYYQSVGTRNFVETYP